MREPDNYLPQIELQKYIASYAFLEIPEGVTEDYFSPPIGLSGFIIQIINHKNIIAKIEGKDFFTERAVVTGQVTHPVYGEVIGESKSLMIFFQPLGIYQLFGLDMATITNKSMPLNKLLGEKTTKNLLSSLNKNLDNESLVEVLNQFFINFIPSTNETDKISNILNFIHENYQNVTIKDIEAHSYYQRKTLERHFKKMIGLTPKVYILIYQFKILINLLQQNPEITWVELANLAGYYDQSHMSRYLKEYLKVPPNSIAKLDMDFINYLLNR